MLPVFFSVIGLISIPGQSQRLSAEVLEADETVSLGMMTGALIAGKSVEQAARLQMILIFSE
jgi:ABC-type iron transport system FetAB permease component